MVTSVIGSYSSCSQAAQSLYAMEDLKGKMPANKDGAEELENILHTFMRLELKVDRFPFDFAYCYVAKVGKGSSCVQDSSSLKERKELKALGEQLLALQDRKDSWPTLRNSLIFTSLVTGLVCGVVTSPYLVLQIGVSIGVWASAVQIACGVVVALAIVSGIREGLYCKRLTNELPGRIRNWADTVAVNNLDIPNKIALHKIEVEKVVARINLALSCLDADHHASASLENSEKSFKNYIDYLNQLDVPKLLHGSAQILPNSGYGLSRLTA